MKILGMSEQTFELPLGFGVRQSSGAFVWFAAVGIAPEGWRSPRRYRASVVWSL
jgi:hypothetical protein